MEKWKQIPGFAKYSISNYGRVRKDISERILAQSENQYGVVCIGLMRDGQQYHRSVPKLVAKAFLPHVSRPFDTPINLDGDRRNNHIDNLAWRPRWFAVMYNRQFRIPYENPITQNIIDTETDVVYANSLECAIANGLLEKDVVLSILNRTVTWPTYQEFEVLE